MEKLVKNPMRIYSGRVDKYSHRTCSCCDVCGGDHEVIIIIPLSDCGRRVISQQFPDSETELARLGLKVRRLDC